MFESQYSRALGDDGISTRHSYVLGWSRGRLLVHTREPSFFRQGLKAVRESDGGTEADEGVQRLIRRRIQGYPDDATANMHHARSVKNCNKCCQIDYSRSAYLLHPKLQLCFRPLRTLTAQPCNSWPCSRDRCFLPIAAALAFRDTPGLVAAAVRTFCSGDPADKRLGVRMARLLAVPSSVAEAKTAGSAKSGSHPAAPVFVEARVAFTRHLYAQLHQAAFVPAKAFPPG